MPHTNIYGVASRTALFRARKIVFFAVFLCFVKNESVPKRGKRFGTGSLQKKLAAFFQNEAWSILGYFFYEATQPIDLSPAFR
jgi:hypothetical protein